jgi:hypothetical protein
MKPGERIHPRPVMNDAQRRYHHGPLQPMQAAPTGDIFETLFGRLLAKVKR